MMTNCLPNTTRLTSSSDACDVSEIFFTNLLVLGFEPSVMEKKYRIPFNKDMFSLPNKKGFEAVARFLFSRLDEARCQEEFRDCWNVRDKKEEQMFRKICNNWLGQIAKDDPNSYLPRIVSSLFMSPGGDKFNQFMLCFSRYVLQRVMIQENGAKSIKDFLGHPVLTVQNSQMSPLMVSSIMAGSVRQRQKFLQCVQDSVFVQEEWNKFAHDQIKDYRSKIKRMRDLERQIEEEKLRMSERVAANTSVLHKKRKSGVTDYDFDIQAVKRAQIVQQVRSMWKVFEDFHASQSFDREIIDSILTGSLEKYRIDAAELNIKIPDMLLRKCEQELQRRNVENIYHCGKVNLLSLIHLWNLSLHLYAEKLHEVGVPKLDAVVPGATTMVQTHRAHCANSESLRQNLELNLLPDVKHSIDHLKKELDKECLSSPASLRITALGLGLMPPTPPVNFDPNESLPSRTDAVASDLRLNPNQVTTPDGAAQLMRDISDKVQSRHSGLVQGTPVYAPTDRIRALNVERSKSNVPALNGMESDYRGLASNVNTKSTTVAEPPAQQKASRFPASHVKGDAWQRSQATTHVMSTQATMISKSTVTRDSRTLNTKQLKPVASTVRPTASTVRPTVSKKSGSHARPVVAKVDRHNGMIVSSTQASRNHIDTLASKIADAVCSVSPETEVASKMNSFDDVPIDDNAFMSRDRLEHTPPSAQLRSWHDTLLQDSIGPLSSTHIESPMRASLNRDSIDQVAVRLFPTDIDGEVAAVIGLNAERPASYTASRGNLVEMDGRLEVGSPLLGAETPSTICSESPVNVEPKDDFIQRSTLDEGKKLRNEGQVQYLKERSGVGKRGMGSDGEREEGEMEDVENTMEEEEAEEEEEMDVVVDRRETDGIEAIWRLSAVANRHGHGLSATHQGDPSNFDWHKQRIGIARHEIQDCDVTNAGQGRFDSDDLEAGVDDLEAGVNDGVMTRLDETLKFLRDTRTPCLPNRFSRLTGRLQDTGSLDGSGSQGTSINVSEDGKCVSVTASEPGYRPHDNEHSFGVGSSLPLGLDFASEHHTIDVAEIHKSKSANGTIIRDTDAKFSNEAQNLTDETNLKNVRPDGLQTDVISSHEINEDDRTVQTTTGDLSLSLRLGSGNGDNCFNSSLKQRQDLTQQSTKALDVSQNSSRTDDIDSLISRYRNLRLQQATDSPKLVSANEQKSQVALSMPFSSANTDRGDACTPFSRRSSKAEDGRVSLSRFDGTGARDSMLGRELTTDARVEDLEKENFDDIRCLLLETSLTAATPNPRSHNRLSMSFCDQLAPSPLTDAVHSTDVSFARLNDSTINLLDLDDSILVPSSPANQIGASVATGNLVDLS